MDYIYLLKKRDVLQLYYVKLSGSETNTSMELAVAPPEGSIALARPEFYKAKSSHFCHWKHCDKWVCPKVGHP